MTSSAMENQTLQELTYQKIRQMIMNGELSPGQRAKEASLATQIGASRVPIRESLFRLSAEGVIVQRPNCGFVVKKYAPKDLCELYQFRECVEGMAARLAAQNATLEQIGECQAIYEKQSRLVERCYTNQFDEQTLQSSYSEIISLDEEFHRLILRISDNSRFERVYSILHLEKVCISRDLFSNKHPKLMVKNIFSTVRHHGKILEAIRRRNANRAEKIMRQHISNALIYLLKELK